MPHRHQLVGPGPDVTRLSLSSSFPSSHVAEVPDRVPRPRSTPTPLWLVAAAVLAAVVLRAWILGSPLGRVDADETVPGLMARAFLRGDLSVFFWGQAYGGTIETAIVAMVFRVAGTSTLALKLVPVFVYGSACLLVWRVGRRTIGEPAASGAGLLFLLYPATSVWWSTKEYGYYAVALVLGLSVLLFALRIHDSADDPSVRDLAALGLLAGLSWWTTPQTVYLVLPVLGWLAVRHTRLWWRAWPAVPAAVVGALPWIAWNLRHGFSSLHEPEPWFPTTYAERLESFVERVVPTLLGAREAFSGEWLLGAFGVVLAGVALASWIAAVVRTGPWPDRLRPVEPLLVVLVAFPFLVAIPKASYWIAEPRYGWMLTPVIVLLLALPLVSVRRQVVAVVVAAGLAAATIGALQDYGERNPMSVSLRPARLAPLVATLDSRGVDRVYADYWIAYPLTFETRERIVGSPVDAVRSAHHQQLVVQAHASTYVVFRDSLRDAGLAPALPQLGVGYERVETGLFAVYFLDAPVAPKRLRSVWAH